MKSTREIIKKTIDDMGNAHSEEVKKAVEKLALDIYEKGMLPKDAMGLSDDMIEGLYTFGHRLYTTGKYDQAAQLFRLLIMLDSTQARFMMGLAACLHMKKDFESAATAYLLCGILDPRNPLPHYHAADCYMEMNQPGLAIQSLECSIACAGNRPEFAAIKDRSQVMINGLREKIDPGQKPEKSEIKAA